jgi:hypothetical protein
MRLLAWMEMKSKVNFTFASKLLWIIKLFPPCYIKLLSASLSNVSLWALNPKLSYKPCFLRSPKRHFLIRKSYKIKKFSWNLTLFKFESIPIATFWLLKAIRYWKTTKKIEQSPAYQTFRISPPFDLYCLTIEMSSTNYHGKRRDIVFHWRQL